MPYKKFSELGSSDLDLARELISSSLEEVDDLCSVLATTQVYYISKEKIKAHQKENKGAFTKSFLEYVDTDDYEWQKFVGSEFAKLTK